MPALVAQGLTKIYGNPRISGHKALTSVDLTVEHGEFVGIMGPSGSGKTTLLNLLSTIDRPTSGTLTVAGEDALRLNARALALFRRRRLGFIFQDFNLLDTLSLKDNIGLPLALDKRPAAEILQRVDAMAKRLGIDPVLDHYPHQVSGGQAQRAAAARALIHDPDLILADEPTGNLDSRSSHELLTALQDAHRERHATLLLVTHDPFAASFCERIILIRDGQVYGELRAADTRQAFFTRILDALAAIGGEPDVADDDRRP